MDNIDPLFSYDYEGPASFYKLLSTRNKLNPFICSRNISASTDPQYSAKTRIASIDFVVHIKRQFDKAGRFLVCLAETVSDGSGLKTVMCEKTVHGYDVGKNQIYEDDIVFNIESKALNCQRKKAYLVVMLYVQSLNPAVSSSKLSSQLISESDTDIIRKAVNSLCNSTDSSKSSSSLSSSTYLSVIETLPKLKRRFSTESTHNATPLAYQSHNINEKSYKSKFQCIGSMPITVPLLSKSKTLIKSDYSVKVSIKWRRIRKQSDDANQKLSLSFDDPLYNRNVFFHYLFFDPGNDEVKSVVERRSSLSCPWCDFCIKRSFEGFNRTSASENVGVSLYLHHLTTYHFHFSFEPMYDPRDNIHIVVRRDRHHDCDSKSILKENILPYYFYANRSKSTILQPIPKILSEFKSLSESRNTNGKLSNSSQDYLNSISSRKRSFQDVIAPARQYYHARSGLPVKEDEIAFDSDHEVDNTNELVASNKALDEFEDISYEEKEFMKLWNSYMHVAIPYSDAYIPFNCEQFARSFGRLVLDKNLRHNFALHLFNMWDFGLLRADDIQRSLAIVDAFEAAKSTV